MNPPTFLLSPGLDVERGEFCCPLCKSLNNCILPVAWIDKKEEVLKNVNVESLSDFGSWVSTLKSKFEISSDEADSRFRDSLSPVVNILVDDWDTFIKHFFTNYGIPKTHANEDLKEMHLMSAHLLEKLNKTHLRVIKKSSKWLQSAICYTAVSIELASRDASDVSVRDFMSDNSLSTMRILCEFALTYSYSSNLLKSLNVMQSKGLVKRIFGGLNAIELVKGGEFPVLQEDAFCLFVDASLVLVPKGVVGGKEVLKWMRLFYYLNVMQSLVFLATSVAKSSNVVPDTNEVQAYPKAKPFLDWFITRMGFVGSGIITVAYF
jgi:hypothetical protein